MLEQADQADAGYGGIRSDRVWSRDTSLDMTWRELTVGEEAPEALEATIDAGWRGPWARPWLDRDTDFDALRGNRRFERLAARVGPGA